MAFKFLIILLFILCNTLTYADSNKCIVCHTNECKIQTNEKNCIKCHRGNDKTTRKNTAHYRLIEAEYSNYYNYNHYVTKKGIELINISGCRRCHIIGDDGSKYASNLNSSIKRLSTNDIIKAVKKPAENMPKFNFTNQDMKSLITGLYYYTIDKEPKSVTQLIHLDDSSKSNIFTNKCGSCHRILTDKGVKGSSDKGPNLSGIGGKYYNNDTVSKWDKKTLYKWLTNPRSIKKYSIMPVIELTEQEKEIIIDLLLNDNKSNSKEKNK